MERRPLFGTVGWWEGKRTFFTNDQFDGVLKNVFYGRKELN